MFCVSTVSAADGDIIYVNNNTGNDSYDGLNATYDPITNHGPKLSIKNATGTVNTNGTVYIADGTYTGENNTNIFIDKNMDLFGQSQTGTIINRADADVIFAIAPFMNVTLQNLTFTNGNRTIGGVIYNFGGNITLKGCIFTNNTASDGDGGAIRNYMGNINLNGCIFTNNTASDGNGGAIHNYYGTIALSGCTFTNNTASEWGGAIYNDEGNITLTACTFTNNTANEYEGGAIHNDEGNITLTACTFTNNHAYWHGGAIYNSEGNTTLTGCTFTGNTANATSGAIGNDGNLNVTDSTFTNNTAIFWAGGAIMNQGTCTITGSTFTGNTAGSQFLGGGAIVNIGTCTAHFNRIVGNTANQGSAIYNSGGSVDVNNNWWGSNLDPKSITNLIAGDDANDVANVNTTTWIILTVNATPNSINNTQTSTITADFNHINGGGVLTGGHIPDGPITLDVPWGSLVGPISALLSGNLLISQDVSGTAHGPLYADIEEPILSITWNFTAITHSITSNTAGGVIAATFYANEGAVDPLFNPVKVTATADNYTTNNTESAYITINKASDLYIKITSNNNNPKVGETFTITYKLGNKGPDEATNVTITILLPQGFEYTNISGDGNWTYNANTNTITWTLASVPVGDPYLYISGHVNKPGAYVFGSSISSDTYNINTEGVTPITINSVSEVKAASETIPMQETGLPISGLILAILAVFGGLAGSKRK